MSAGAGPTVPAASAPGRPARRRRTLVWRLAGRRRELRLAATLVALGVVAVLLLEGLVVVGVNLTPDLRTTVLDVRSQNGTLTVTFELRAGPGPVSAHVALLPGSVGARGPVYFFADSAYPDTYGSYTYTREIGERVALLLAGVASAPPVGFVDGPGLRDLLDIGGPATVVVLGGIVPDFVLSNSTGLLPSFVREGGTLIWAGGPLGAQEGHPLPNAPFEWNPMGWAGQVKLAGYRVSDVLANNSSSPLLAAEPSPIGSALGIRYNGTPSGANVSELAAHDGLDLGFTSGPDPSGAAPRSSLAYLPVGHGSIFFFGGSFSPGTRAFRFVPSADFSLSADLGLLLGTGYEPAAGASAARDVSLPAYGSAVVTLSLPMGGLGGQAVALVAEPGIPTYGSIWSTELTWPTGP